jgi:hypothetical protein
MTNGLMTASLALWLFPALSLAAPPVGFRGREGVDARE